MSINRREFLKTATVGAAMMALPDWVKASSESAKTQSSSAPSESVQVKATSRPSDRPNILLILSDDQSVPHLGCYNNPDIRTPNLDKLAAQGMRFDRAYVTCPQCSPSRSSIFTGRSPIGIQTSRFFAPLPAEVKTCMEHLKGAGYYTGLAGRSHHQDGAGSYLPQIERLFEQRGLRTMAKRVDFLKIATKRPEVLTQYREFLDQVPHGSAGGAHTPFFLQLCFFEPHRPLAENVIPQPHDPKTLKLPGHFPDIEPARVDLALYYDAIARMDMEMGEVLAELERRGLADNTVVVFMGDNGASQLRGKGTLFEFGIHVPLLVRWPRGIKPASSCENLISGEDLCPTFLDLAGLDAPAEITGKSFLPQLRGQASEQRKYVFAERGAHGYGLPYNTVTFDQSRCVVSDTHKLIYNAMWQQPYVPVDFSDGPLWKEMTAMHKAGTLSPQLDKLYFPPTRPMFELYNLKDDPFEMNTLCDEPSVQGLWREMALAMTEWMIMERDFLPLPVEPKP